MTSLSFQNWIFKYKEGTVLINDNSELWCNGSITNMKMYFQGCQNKTLKQEEKKNSPSNLAHDLISRDNFTADVSLLKNKMTK